MSMRTSIATIQRFLTIHGALTSIALAQTVATSDLERARNNTRDWLMYGRDYFAHRYVELDQINPANIHRLHPVWVFATGGENRGLQATPLIRDGVLYIEQGERPDFIEQDLVNYLHSDQKAMYEQLKFDNEKRD